ncbi:hypothetical protein HYW58_00240 [Candidatus Kaiserbacteria bacterium]|nr:hypothetical protein [Candidatus Kaiserbacteria bacterium]
MKPQYIQKAVVQGESEFLRRAGRKGGMATARKRERQKILDDRAEELREREEEARRRDANEHVIPVFGPEAPNN